MKESFVLIFDLTPTCTELARHLVLSGINLSILYKNDIVSEDDIENDFLFSQLDIGQKVSNNI